MALIVQSLFGVATIQGPPRTSGRKFGIPPGGFADPESAAIANLLVGNRLDSRILELAAGAIILKADADALLSVVGAPSSVTIDERTMASNRNLFVRNGESIRISNLGSSNYAYIALSNGDVEAATSVRVGSRFECGPSGRREAVLDEAPHSLQKRSIHYIRSEAFQPPLPTQFRVSHLSNRVGVRLDPPSDAHTFELTSEPATPGAIQWTPSGQLIVLGPDGPTIGGYPKIGYVIQSDLASVLQAATNSAIELEPVSLEVARQRNLESSRRIQARIAMLASALGQ